MRKTCFLGFILVLSLTASAQQKWDLRQCVDYAIQNNISVRQSDLQARFSELAYKQSVSSQLPSLNAGGSVGYRLGRSENPTTGVLEDNNFFNTGLQMQSGVNLFNWFAAKYNREANKLSWNADKEQAKKVQDDISLSVAVAYLQVLLAREQSGIAAVQVSQTQKQLETTKVRVAAGALPELNAAELEAQLARDSSSLISAQATAVQFLLQLKALLNLDAAADFDIAVPPVDFIPLESIASLQPEAVYLSALQFLPQQKVNKLRIAAAQKNVSAAHARLFPSFNAFGSLSTNAIDFKKAIYNQVFNGYVNSSARVNAGGGVFYPVEIPSYTPGSNIVSYYRPGSISSQFKTNFGQSVGISMSVPVFNGRSAKTNLDRTKLTVQQLQLQLEQGEKQLKQDIYKAYNDATTAMQKHNADVKSLSTANRAYEYAKKRYDANLLSSYDLLNSNNNVLRAKIQALYSQYDFVFKMKLLEYYKGQGLKL
jgi:outer membrane protein